MIGKLLDHFNNSNLEPISGLDATFLYIENPTNHMHVGSVAVIEGSIEFETFCKSIHSRLHLVPRLRKKLVYVPMSIDYPYWVDDPNFDIGMHIKRIALPKPGSWKELRAAASQIFSEPLDKSRPLWSFTFVEGLDDVSQVPPGSIAIITKVHHVAIDGVAGEGLLHLLFDMSPEVKEIPEPKPWKPKPLPNEISMVMKSTLSFASNPLKFPKLLSNVVSATLKAGFVTRGQSLELPTAPFTAPPSPLNGIIAARRMWNTAILSLDRVKALKSKMGTTLNDIILAICAGALRKYLMDKEKLPHKPLVAMVPISTRTKEDKGNLNNQISSMLIQLGTNIEDPIERLAVIHENTIRGKTYQEALGAKTLAQMAQVVPFGVANQAARLYSRFRISEMHNPVFNVTITNVPGPQFPLYLNGHKLISIMGMAPIIDGMGLIITVFSYNGLITLSPTSDAKTMPDIDKFARYLRESANYLEEKVMALEKAKVKKKEKKKAVKAKSDALFLYVRKYLKEHSQYIKPDNGIFQFNVTGDLPTYWKIDIDKSPGEVRRGKAAKPDAVFTIQDNHLMRIADGKLNVQTAFIQGRLKITGDTTKAMKLGTILGKIIAYKNSKKKV